MPLFSAYQRCLFLTAVISAGVLSACKTTVEEVPLQVALPQEFSRSGTRALPDKWWEDFNDEQLSGLVETALENNFSLKTTWNRLAAAQAQYRLSSADLWPSLDASVGYQERWARGSASSGIAESGTWSARLTAQYELDLWGRIRSEQQAALLDTRAREVDIQTAAITLSSSVARTWFQLQEQRAQVELLDRQIETTSSTLKTIETRFASGLTTSSDVLQQRQLLEARNEDKERAVSELDSLEIALAILVGSPPHEFEAPQSTFQTQLSPLPSTGIASDKVLFRPDIRSAYLSVQSADQRVAAAIANRYPRITLTGSFTDSDERWRDLFDNWIATLVADVVAPVLDGGARRAEVERTRFVAIEQLNDYSQRVLDALGEVEQALVAEHYQRRIVTSIEKQLDVASEVTDRIRADYLNGRGDFLRVLSAQQSQQQLERELISSRRVLLESRVDLCRALSAGWEMQDPTLAQEVEDEEIQYPLPLSFARENTDDAI